MSACGSKGKDDPGSEGASKKGQAMAVDVVVLEPREMKRELEVSGSILPNEQVSLKSQVRGRIMKIAFDEGERVEAGDLLVQVDDRARKAQLKRSRAQLELARKQLERKEQLLASGGISQEAVDKARNEVATLEADIQEMEVYIDNASIEAPFSGRVGLRQVSPGQMLMEGDPIAALVKADPLKLEFQVPGEYATMIERDQEVTFTLERLRDTLRARVYAMEPAVNKSSRSLRVRALVEGQDEKLTPGAFVDATLGLKKLDSALMVPSEAIVRDLNAKKIWVMDRGEARPVEVETGFTRRNTVQLRAGVSPHDTVLITGLLQAKPGMKVKPREVIDVGTLEEN